MPPALHPRTWGFHLLALVLVALAGWLGWWQIQAWQAARDAEAVDLTLTEAVPLEDVFGHDDPFPAAHVGQPVTVTGTWLPESTVYVSGRREQGTDGFWAVTPVSVESTGSALYVVRGWTPSVSSAPAAPSGPAEVEAWLQPAEGTGVMDDDPTDDVLPQLRIADVIQHVDQDLYGGYAVLTEPEPGLSVASLDQLPPVGGFTSIRNLLYGIEWWVFGLFAGFIWWRWLRDEVLAVGADEGAEESPDEDPEGDPEPVPAHRAAAADPID